MRQKGPLTACSGNIGTDISELSVFLFLYELNIFIRLFETVFMTIPIYNIWIDVCTFTS